MLVPLSIAMAAFLVIKAVFSQQDGHSLVFAMLGMLVAYAFLALLKASIYLLMAAVIVQAVLSWIAPHGPVAGVLNAMTFRFLRPIRNVVPLIGGQLDLSPLIVIVLCQLVLLLPVAWLEQALLRGNF